MSGGSKHEQAGVAWWTLPPLVVETFKLFLKILSYGDEEFFTAKEIHKEQKKGHSVSLPG